MIGAIYRRDGRLVLARQLAGRVRRRPQTLKPRARSCSRPSSVILSGPHGGIQTQLMRVYLTMPDSAELVWSSMTSVSGQAADVSVMSRVHALSSSTWMP
jgi:hypothetical protein